MGQCVSISELPRVVPIIMLIIYLLIRESHIDTIINFVFMKKKTGYISK